MYISLRAKYFVYYNPFYSPNEILIAQIDCSTVYPNILIDRSGLFLFIFYQLTCPIIDSGFGLID